MEKIYVAIDEEFPDEGPEKCPDDLILRIGKYLEKLAKDPGKINAVYFVLKRNKSNPGVFKKKILEDLGEEMNDKKSEEAFEMALEKIYNENKIGEPFLSEEYQ